jgi:hypothetical protein
MGWGLSELGRGYSGWPGSAAAQRRNAHDCQRRNEKSSDADGKQ